MKLNLSSFLQWKFNITIYMILGWKFAFLYMVILGKLYFFFKPTEKRKIETAVDDLFSGRFNQNQQKVIKRNVFRGIISHYYEKLYNAYENIEKLESFFRESILVDCFHKMDHALRKQKGVIFVTGHYGGIEYIPIFLAMKKYPISVVAKFATQQLKDTLYLRTKDLGLKIIDTNEEKSALACIVRELKANRIVFIECDEIETWRGSQKETMTFLNRVIGVDRTIRVLQKRTGAEVIFGLLHRYSLQEYKLIMKNYQDMLHDAENASSSIGETVLKTFERYIYKHPEEWYQWKNLEKIATASKPGLKAERPAHFPSLEPAFFKI